MKTGIESSPVSSYVSTRKRRRLTVRVLIVLLGLGIAAILGMIFAWFAG